MTPLRGEAGYPGAKPVTRIGARTVRIRKLEESAGGLSVTADNGDYRSLAEPPLEVTFHALPDADLRIGQPIRITIETEETTSD